MVRKSPKSGSRKREIWKGRRQELQGKYRKEKID
jgi:hypothetical protein